MKLKVLALVVFIVVNSIIIEKIVSNQYQIPALRIREGLIVKRLQRMALVGGDSFNLSRSSLSNNRLNLSHWYGNQEVRFENEQKIHQIKYKFNLGESSDLFVYWNHNRSKVDGLRIQNNKKLSLRRQINEKVEDVFLANLGRLQQSVLLEINQVNNELVIKINNDEYVVKDNILEGTWGVRGDETPIEVEEIKVTYADSSDYYQNFEPRFSPKYFTITLIFLTLLSFLVYFFSINTILYLKYLLFIFVSTFYFIDTKLMSIQQVEALTGSLTPVKENSFWGSLEYYRTKLFYPGFVLDEMRDFTYFKYPKARIVGGPIVCVKKEKCRYYPKLTNAFLPKPETGVKRIMFVGTSQTIGAGASEIRRTFFSRLHRKINQAEAAISLNISQSALSPEEMFARFLDAIQIYKPTHVIVNLGYNRSDYSLVKTLMDYYDFAKKINAKIVFMREANNLAITSDYLKEVDQFTKENSLPTIDLYGYLRSPQVDEDLSIWWDPVHFNDRGQRLAADFIYEEFLKLQFLKM